RRLPGRQPARNASSLRRLGPNTRSNRPRLSFSLAGTALPVRDAFRDGPAFSMTKESRMAWILLTFAGLLEIVWAFSMKQSEGFTRLVPSVVTIVTMIASFALLSLSMRTLPLGTAYTVWTGIGAVGA